ncbi:uncharacterized protein LOC129610110 isoform X2 [Condylostylus longicornis]|uniref:uncharacterized protein LOC129610110 isoform X2 n=1 Tax=Condylostylus longicornis TaxID=2530218 RepID=UPI00244E33AF|nr:uncharacterized protein LOC129610110 isoform X2 [Condylostylus longicornis]XP_055378455.1 uncharacterized protein LOC129610110 isoform X2 [Condylostylus longicornis]XP_055378456.1 uncharacterized protein LOC129610110 isoform X2 [Condylostylus longicornis]
MALPANYKQIASNLPTTTSTGHMMSSPVPPTFNILKERLRAPEGTKASKETKDTTPIFSHSNYGNPAFTPQKAGKSSKQQAAEAARVPKPPKPPEKPMMPYMRYSKKMWDSVKAANPDLKIWELGKKIGAMWKSASDLEKQEFIDEYEAEKVKYEELIKQYHSTPEYIAWMKYKSKQRDADVHETPSRAGGKGQQERRIDIQPAEDEDDQDDGYSVKHVAYARFIRNHRLINEIFSDAVVPDVRSVVTTQRMQVLKRQVTSLTMHQTKLEAELQQMEEKFETKKRKLLESSEIFQEELKKHCKPAVDEETFQKMVQKAYEDLKRERSKTDEPLGNINNSNPQSNAQKPIMANSGSTINRNEDTKTVTNQTSASNMPTPPSQNTASNASSSSNQTPSTQQVLQPTVTNQTSSNQGPSSQTSQNLQNGGPPVSQQLNPTSLPIPKMSTGLLPEAAPPPSNSPAVHDNSKDQNEPMDMDIEPPSKHAPAIIPGAGMKPNLPPPPTMNADKPKTPPNNQHLTKENQFGIDSPKVKGRKTSTENWDKTGEGQSKHDVHNEPKISEQSHPVHPSSIMNPLQSSPSQHRGPMSPSGMMQTAPSVNLPPNPPQTPTGPSGPPGPPQQHMPTQQHPTSGPPGPDTPPVVPPTHHGPPSHHMSPHMGSHHPGMHPNYGGYAPPPGPPRSPYYAPQYGGHPPPQPYGQYAPYPYHQQYAPPPGHYMGRPGPAGPPMHYDHGAGQPPPQHIPPQMDGHHNSYGPPAQNTTAPPQVGPPGQSLPPISNDEAKRDDSGADSDKKDSE